MFEIDWRTPHLWRKTSKEAHIDRAPLRGEVEADVVVVGGGSTGLSSALALAEARVRTIVLEGNEIGSAASGRNNGLLVPHHSKASPSEIVHAFGPVVGERYNALVAGAARAGFDLMERHGIRCDAVRRGWIQPAHSPQALARVRKFHDEWRAFGCAVEWLDAEADRTGRQPLSRWLACRPTAAMSIPMRWLRAWRQPWSAQVPGLYEEAKVTAIERAGARAAVDLGRDRHGQAGAARGDQRAYRRLLAEAVPGAHSPAGLPGRDRAGARASAPRDPAGQPGGLRHAARHPRLSLRCRLPDRHRGHPYGLESQSQRDSPRPAKCSRKHSHN